MPITDHKNYSFSFSMIDIKQIDPSPFQHRKYFDQGSLRELGASIVRDGLIEPIIVRSQQNGRFQLIAGERRLRAVKDFTDITMIQAKIADVDDLHARRMSTSENILRQDLSAIESIEATIAIIDEEMEKDTWYLTGGKTPLERVHKLLSKLHSIRVCKDKGSQVSREAEALLNKFIQPVESIFKNLPKPLKWQSFLMNDLNLLTDIPLIVQKESKKHDLNKAQIKALAKLEKVSDKAFQDVTRKGSIPFKDQNNSILPTLKLNECSAREIQNFAKEIEKTNVKHQQKTDPDQCEFSTQIKIAVMTRLGIPLVRIAQRLNIHRETISNHAGENQALFNKIYQEFKAGAAVPDMAQEYGAPQSLVWSVVLQDKTDQERFKALNWGLRAWDNWYFNDVDHRFGDPWPGRIPAQLVAHTLFYFTRENDLVLDPMAGGGVVADTCLAFNRRCWSFDLLDRMKTRPEIEPFLWDPEKMAWPVSSNKKPDLIFFDPPYFKKMAAHYREGSISDFPRFKYLHFFKTLFSLLREHSKPLTRMAFLNSDFRDFQGIPAIDEDPDNAILVLAYAKLLETCGWKITHLLDCPLSTERFTGHMVNKMHENRTLGVVRRTLIVGKANSVYKDNP
ncbi:MAG: ParB/RepB/Spo0J family partition protein [Desulfobacula sp.]|uniref:ParB/RepB/Spo0J family partition protein n=2 Tax=Desulfobacula sp. TaxID=2593537 RepID=UPI001DF4BD5E|nr:ParB/RepB/Spo0J family partition protein [Desulfobacula sp.]MBT5971653.1 ParB/RepB/Spo0J family partition protein [Desulfobacula sp.]MBT6750679.1 ParB/RepB/Spo0J family partition protein [Desulfobacula sp.]